MSEIKIAVACHKPSVLPKNPLFIPIQVGAIGASLRMEDMLHDDEGINISAKNPMYCELTAQYWLWKNMEADYYGLCHYRRYLCFADVNARKNERGQFVAFAITPYNIKKYGLENEAEMRKIIESNDIVVGPEQDISRVDTYLGKKSTAYEHWAAHDRRFIMINDINNMLDILDEVAPSVGKDAREYLSGKTFLGFNCFVLKKELFKEMCAIEFEVLKRLEGNIDSAHYNQVAKRVYGYMGEIICSAYIYHVKKQEGKYKVKHLPLVYFQYTDTLMDYDPLDKENVISVLFNFSEQLDFKFAPEWQSFLDTCDTEHFYDVLLVMDSPSGTIKNVYLSMVSNRPNISLRFIDSRYIKNLLKDEYGNDINVGLVMPFFLKKYKKMLVFGPRLLFRKPVVEMWKTCLPADKIVAAPKDVYMLGRINDFYYETEEEYLSTQLKNMYNYFSSDTMLVNFEAYRRYVEIGSLFGLKMTKTKDGEKPRRLSEIYNIICEDNALNIEQKWNVLYETSQYLKNQLHYAPDDDHSALLNAQKDPCIISYVEEEIFIDELSEPWLIYWENARKTPVYEALLESANQVKFLKNSKFIKRLNFELNAGKRDVLNKIFPQGSRRHDILKKCFPKDSMQRKLARKLLNRVR